LKYLSSSHVALLQEAKSKLNEAIKSPSASTANVEKLQQKPTQFPYPVIDGKELKENPEENADETNDDKTKSSDSVDNTGKKACIFERCPKSSSVMH
jgi:hypothetical protein